MVVVVVGREPFGVLAGALEGVGSVALAAGLALRDEDAPLAPARQAVLELLRLAELFDPVHSSTPEGGVS